MLEHPHSLGPRLLQHGTILRAEQPSDPWDPTAPGSINMALLTISPHPLRWLQCHSKSWAWCCSHGSSTQVHTVPYTLESRQFIKARRLLLGHRKQTCVFPRVWEQDQLGLVNTAADNPTPLVVDLLHACTCSTRAEDWLAQFSWYHQNHPMASTNNHCLDHSDIQKHHWCWLLK